MQSRVLAVVPDRSSFQALKAALRGHDFALVWRTSTPQAYELLRREDYDAVVCDLDVSDQGALRFCEQVRANFSDIPVIVVAESPSLESALAALRIGASDYLRKPATEQGAYRFSGARCTVPNSGARSKALALAAIHARACPGTHWAQRRDREAGRVHLPHGGHGYCCFDYGRNGDRQGVGGACASQA